MDRLLARETTGRACDRCRRIKIKCDAGKNTSSSPRTAACSTCQRCGHACTFDVPLRRRGPRKRSPRPSSPRPLASPSMPVNYGASSPSSSGLTAQEASEMNSFESPVVPVAGTGNSIGHTPSPTVEGALEHLLQVLPMTRYPAGEDLMAACIDLYLRHLFPITPVVHEASARATCSWAATLVCRPPQAMPLSLQQKRSLTLLTAICATASSLLPVSLLPEGPSLAGPFLDASRSMLRLYGDEDIDRPEASSVIVRYFHAISIHAKGNTRVSWYVMGEAIRLALEMRLYDETSLSGLDPVEAQLRRAIYWQLHTGDRSAAILNERPYTLAHLSLDTPLTIVPMRTKDTHLLDMTRLHNTPAFVQCLNEGFNLSTRLFTTAATVLADLRLLGHFAAKPASFSGDLVRGQRAAIVDSVLDFRRVLDDMPPWLERPWLADLDTDVTSATYQRDSLWVQHVNLKLTFHCLRLILLQKASEAGYASLLGHSDHARLTDMHKTDIARDVLACIEGAPFQALQINGESCVEKIRQVGATLLQLSQGTEEHVAARSKADFQVLLDVLTRLDSKVSAAMCRDVEVGMALG